MKNDEINISLIFLPV